MPAIPCRIRDRAAGATTLALAATLAAALAACTDPVAVGALPPGEEGGVPVADQLSCEDFAPAARSLALQQGIHAYCFTPSIELLVWDPVIPRGDGMPCTCQGTNDR